MVQIVMEYCAGGSISDIMTILGKSLNEDQIAVVIHYVLLGLKYLHSVKKIRTFLSSPPVRLLLHVDLERYNAQIATSRLATFC
jgi:serine/threonine protein kinase